MISYTHLLEILFLFLFLIIAVSFIKKKGFKEFLYFSLPIILFFYFVEFFWCYREKGVYITDNFRGLLFNIPLIVPVVWVIFVFTSMKLTEATFQKCKIIRKENPVLSLSDAFWSVLFAILVTEPLSVNLGFWQHKTAEPFFSGAPLWYFVGWFLGVFICSFGYRVSKFLEKSKRIIFLIGYISLVIIFRVIFYRMFKF